MEDEIKKLQMRLGVSDEDVLGMIEVLIRAGYSKFDFAFLTQSGEAYSLAFDEIRVRLLAEGKITL